MSGYLDSASNLPPRHPVLDTGSSLNNVLSDYKDAFGTYLLDSGSAAGVTELEFFRHEEGTKSRVTELAF